jgi:hypothetical protein
LQIGRSAGNGFAAEKVSRGLASGDIDNDGDLDLLVTNNGQTADLLRNDTISGNSLLVRAVARVADRDAVGARVRVVAGQRTQVRDVRASSSCLGQNDLRLHFGLRDAATVDRIEVRWPSDALRSSLASRRIRWSPSRKVVESCVASRGLDEDETDCG